MQLVIALPMVAAAFMFSTLANAYSQEEVNVFAPTDSEVAAQKLVVSPMNAKNVENRADNHAGGATPSQHATGPETTGSKQLPAPETAK
ncbi:UNVERIFIED_ORG: hypothetical protein J2Y81_004991 [Paraburkholderia sediminicola]|uniref:hypothetical protein n=1 Tax=Paraburkholderia aspalathi TaxID=1324617 RepID=UPI0021110AB8|nr:hypothetical protein [Paraburkholderia sediminicola]